MDINSILVECQALRSLIPRINDREQGAINQLNKLYVQLFGERVRATCSNCHIKAVHRLLSLTLDDIKIMNDQSFKIKKGLVIEWPFRSGQYFSAIGGITDLQAVEYLRDKPARIQNFEVYPGSTSETKQLDLALIGIDENAPVIAPPMQVVKESAKNFAELKDKYSFDLREATFEQLKRISDNNEMDLTDEELDILDAEIEKLKDEEAAQKLKEPKPINRMNKAELTAEYEKEFLELPDPEMTVKQLLKKLSNK